jgi:hypothetical protein
MFFGSFFVHSGYAAIRVAGWWVGFAPGNRSSGQRRATAARALRDAKALDRQV